MAVAKFVAALLLAFVALPMLQTMVVASHGRGGHHYDQTNMFSPRRPVGPEPNYCVPQCAERCLLLAQARNLADSAQFRRFCRSTCRKCCKFCRCVPPFGSGEAVCYCYRITKIGDDSCP